MSIDIQSVKICIENNIERIHTISDVAHLLCVSPNTLKQDFSRIERRGLSEFISERKIKKMKQMLLEDDKCCKFICLDLGFREDGGAHFFKRHSGLTMEEFRYISKIHNDISEIIRKP